MSRYPVRFVLVVGLVATLYTRALKLVEVGWVIAESEVKCAMLGRFTTLVLDWAGTGGPSEKLKTEINIAVVEPSIDIIFGKT